MWDRSISQQWCSASSPPDLSLNYATLLPGFYVFIIEPPCTIGKRRPNQFDQSQTTARVVDRLVQLGYVASRPHFCLATQTRLETRQTVAMVRAVSLCQRWCASGSLGGPLPPKVSNQRHKRMGLPVAQPPLVGFGDGLEDGG
uniref:Uncharacterized protein n=1 Tax=Knipowitschia caucasica TaxID=637954 RepID=A0AAV2MDG7_KNICA